MRAVTELGFIASIAPERNTVQDAPQAGDSFFDTLQKANGTAEEAEKVTDDKPETAAQDDDAAEVKTEEKHETEEKGEEKTEEVQQHDVAAEMMALGRMFTVAVEKGNVLENRTGSPLEAVQALSGDAQGGNAADEAAELLTPVENGEEVLLAEAQGENVVVDAQSFADTMTQTLTETLGQAQAENAPGEAPAPVEIPIEVNAEDAAIQTPARVNPEDVETSPVEAPQVQEDNAPVTEKAESVQPEEALPRETQRPVESGEAAKAGDTAAVAKTQEGASAENSGNADLSESFGGREESPAGNEGSDTSLSAEEVSAAETAEAEMPDVEIPLTETLRSRFSLDNAVQQIDNTELAQAIEKAIERFADDFRLAEVDARQITIRLDPEELGSMSITVAAENNVITAKIVTDNKEAASLLSAQIEQFLEAMEQKGIKVEKAEVIYNSQLDLGGQAPNEHSGGARDESRVVQNISAVEMVEAEEAGRADEDTVPIAAVQDEATNYYVFDDQYVPNHVYKV